MLRPLATAAAVLAAAAALAAPASALTLPDGRGWEMVSPIEKNGGEIQGPGEIFGGGDFQAAADGDAVTYGSLASFGAAQGDPGASQYISRRGGAGWTTENVTAATESGAFGDEPDGAPFQLFAGDLGRAVLSLPERCGGAPCPWRYGLRDDAGGTIATSSAEPDLRFVGADAGLDTAILSTCAALTPNATEATVGGGGCDPAEPNLYRWPGGGPTLVNILPGRAQGTPGAALAAPDGAVSTDGARVYFTVAGDLYLRQAGQTVQVDAAAGGGGVFQTASSDGSVAFFTAGGHLYRYAATGGTATDLTPTGGVEGMLGASPDGSYLYYLTADGLFRYYGGAAIKIADSADPSDYPPATGTARVAANGNLVFLDSARWPGFDNAGYPEVRFYDAAAGVIRCVSCDTSGARARGPATIPGARVNGWDAAAPRAYRPRALSDAGDRLFFESPDSLALGDTNGDVDVYEWEGEGTGSCDRPSGCLALISSGRSADGATFVDASADGGDVYFLTEASLVPSDPGARDLYDARVGGGFPVPVVPVPCLGDACQPIPSPPEDPSPNTNFYRAEANPPVAKVKKKVVHKRHHAKHRRAKHKRKRTTRHRGTATRSQGHLHSGRKDRKDGRR